MKNPRIVIGKAMMGEKRMRLKIESIRDMGATRGTSQSEYCINVILTIDNVSVRGRVSYWDFGNNAEYESILSTNYLIPGNHKLDEYIDLIQECFDSFQDKLFVGQEFEYKNQEWNALFVQLVAFNPVLVPKDIALEIALKLFNNDLDKSFIVEVYPTTDNRFSSKIRHFRGIDANIYGYDLFLCDKTGKVLSTGSFD